VGDIIGIIILQTLRNKRRNIVRRQARKSIDEKLEKNASWLPRFARRWVSRKASRQVADAREY